MNEPDLIPSFAAAAEVHPINVVDQRKDAATHRHAWLTLMSRFLPRLLIRASLSVLLDLYRLPRLSELQRRALKVHAELCGPHRGSGRSGAPPNSITKTLECGSRRSSPGGLRNIGRGVGSAKPLPRSTLRNASACLRPNSASVPPS